MRLLPFLILLSCNPVEEEDLCAEGPVCVENTLHTCSTNDEGEVEVTEELCDPGRCAYDAPVQQCVSATALPCDPSTAEARCENGLLVGCPETRGYWSSEACPSGEVCARDACQPVDDVPCSPSNWSVVCIEGERITCDAQRRRLTTEEARCTE